MVLRRCSSLSDDPPRSWRLLVASSLLSWRGSHRRPWLVSQAYHRVWLRSPRTLPAALGPDLLPCGLAEPLPIAQALNIAHMQSKVNREIIPQAGFKETWASKSKIDTWELWVQITTLLYFHWFILPFTEHIFFWAITWNGNKEQNSSFQNANSYHQNIAHNYFKLPILNENLRPKWLMLLLQSAPCTIICMQ